MLRSTDQHEPWVTHVNFVKDYEFRAQECRKLAKTALPRHRLPLMQMAEMWQRLAAERKQALEKAPSLSQRLGLGRLFANSIEPD